MTNTYPYNYQRQIDTIVGQAMKALSGFVVRDGVERDGEVFEERVHVTYGPMDRIMSAVISTEEKYKNHRVPLIGVNLASIEIAQESRLSSFHRDELTFKTNEANVEGYSTVKRPIGHALNLSLTASIYASSKTQLMEIFEQILLVFNPGITIQKSNSAFDSAYNTVMTLESSAMDIAIPFGSERKIVQMDLDFFIPMRVTYPYKVDDSYIEQILKQTISEDISEETVIGTVT